MEEIFAARRDAPDGGQLGGQKRERPLKKLDRNGEHADLVRRAEEALEASALAGHPGHPGLGAAAPAPGFAKTAKDDEADELASWAVRSVEEEAELEEAEAKAAEEAEAIAWAAERAAAERAAAKEDQAEKDATTRALARAAQERADAAAETRKEMAAARKQVDRIKAERAKLAADVAAADKRRAALDKAAQQMEKKRAANKRAVELMAQAVEALPVFVAEHWTSSENLLTVKQLLAALRHEGGWATVVTKQQAKELLAAKRTETAQACVRKANEKEAAGGLVEACSLLSEADRLFGGNKPKLAARIAALRGRVAAISAAARAVAEPEPELRPVVTENLYDSDDNEDEEDEEDEEGEEDEEDEEDDEDDDDEEAEDEYKEEEDEEELAPGGHCPKLGAYTDLAGLVRELGLGGMDLAERLGAEEIDLDALTMCSAADLVDIGVPAPAAEALVTAVQIQPDPAPAPAAKLDLARRMPREPPVAAEQAGRRGRSAAPGPVASPGSGPLAWGGAGALGGGGLGGLGGLGGGGLGGLGGAGSPLGGLGGGGLSSPPAPAASSAAAGKGGSRWPTLGEAAPVEAAEDPTSNQRASARTGASSSPAAVWGQRPLAVGQPGDAAISGGVRAQTVSPGRPSGGAASVAWAASSPQAAAAVSAGGSFRQDLQDKYGDPLMPHNGDPLMPHPEAPAWLGGILGYSVAEPPPPAPVLSPGRGSWVVPGAVSGEAEEIAELRERVVRLERERDESRKLLEKVRLACAKEMSCVITTEPFQSPTVASDGNTYESIEIREWQERNGTSPITRLPIGPLFTPNLALQRLEHSLSDIFLPR